MARSEKLINIWNGEFPNYPLTVADLKKPHAMIGAFFQVLVRLGIDIDGILSPPPEEERDEHTMYYWDLLPIINISRVINHIVSVLEQAEILSMTFPLTITHFLQPDATTSHSILLLLVNVMAFNENRLKEIAPLEEELFGKRDQVTDLEEKKNKLLQMLNEQAEQKGKRAERLMQIDHDIEQFEEELKSEHEALDKEKIELEAVLEEDRQLQQLLEQKNAQKDAILAEVAKKKALRVYDADDIKAQAEQAALNVQEAEEKLNSLKNTLHNKETSLINLQKIKPTLDAANNLLHEIMKISENLKKFKTDDIDIENKDGEIEVLNEELSEVQSQLAELQTLQTEFNEKKLEMETKRQLELQQIESAIKETEEKNIKTQEQTKKILQEIEEIKERTVVYDKEKLEAKHTLKEVESYFISEFKVIEEEFLKKTSEAERKIKKRLTLLL